MDGLIQFRVDATEVKNKLNGTADRVILALKQRLQANMEALQGKIVSDKLEGNPIKSHTHKLAGSVRVVDAEVKENVITAGVQAGGGVAPYAKFLEYGTGPHDIFPRNAKALRFLMGAEVVFRMQVHHPGTPAFHFMTNAIEQQRAAIIASLKGAIKEAVAAK